MRRNQKMHWHMLTPDIYETFYRNVGHSHIQPVGKPTKISLGVTAAEMGFGVTCLCSLFFADALSCMVMSRLGLSPFLLLGTYLHSVSFCPALYSVILTANLCCQILSLSSCSVPPSTLIASASFH